MLKLRKPPSLKARHAPLPYQLDAVQALVPLEYGAIFHEPGLGKTKIGLDISLRWLVEDKVDTALIITKKGLVNNWREEIQKHSWLTPQILGQNRVANLRALNRPALLYLAHYETVARHSTVLKKFLRVRKVGVILDEAHKIKNPNSAITQELLKLATSFKRRIIMTGTPISNRPYDIWAPIYFLDQGKSLGLHFKKFRQEYDLPSYAATRDYASALKAIFREIRDFSIRETKNSAGIVLPNKILLYEYIDLAPEQNCIYNRYKNELRGEIFRHGQHWQDNAEVVMKRLLRLVQCAANPVLLNEYYAEEPAKLPVLRNILERAIAKGEKAIVWTTFVDNATNLARALSNFGVAQVHGAQNMEQRNRSIQRFKTNPQCKVLVATPGAAKEGLTLTVANHAIFYDRGFSLEDYLQAQDRIHRISQDKECIITNLVARDTVDEWVDHLLSVKQSAAKLAQKDIDTSDFMKQADIDLSAVLKEILNGGNKP